MLTKFLGSWFNEPVRPRVVVVGNRKGGSGKSTAAIHLVSGLLNAGYGVGAVDLDGGQATLSHFVENRQRLARDHGLRIELPQLCRVDPSRETDLARLEADESRRFAQAFGSLIDRDYIVVDTPGSDSLLSRLGHTLADVLVTPLNDSFLDLDVLVRVDLDGRRILGPSDYAVAVLDRWGVKTMLSGEPIAWIVMRNRVSHTGSRNQAQLRGLLEDLAPRLGFRLVEGFGERVIYRELFYQGLTVLDPLDRLHPRAGSHSNGQARKEIWSLLAAIGVPSGSGTKPERAAERQGRLDLHHRDSARLHTR